MVSTTDAAPATPVRPQTATHLVRQPDYSAMLGSLSSEMLWRTIVSQRQQRQEASSLPSSQQPQLQPPSSEGLPQLSSSGGEGGPRGPQPPRPPVTPPPSDAALPRARRTENALPTNGSSSASTFSESAPPAELPDLRSLATQYAHVVSMKRANPASMGATAPLSFTKTGDGPSSQRRTSSFRGRRGSSRGATTTTGSSGGGSNARASVVTAFVVSGGLPVHPSIVQFLVPYERQGNKDFYTPENIQRRLEIRNHHTVIDALDAFWMSLPKALPSRTCINQPMFHWLHSKLYNHFAADPNNVVWTQVVFDDWKASSSNRVTMTQEELQGFMFGFADVWCQTLDEEEYAGFLVDARRVAVLEGLPYMGSYAEDAGPPTTATDVLGPSGGGGTASGAASKARSTGNRPRTSDGKTKASAADAMWTKEFVGELAQIRALQAVAVAQQTEKVVDAFVATGISDVGLSEVRQLQGLFRLVCEVEEREEDELLRLSTWAKSFLEDVLIRGGRNVSSASSTLPAQSVTTSPHAPSLTEDDVGKQKQQEQQGLAVDQLVVHLQRLLQLQEANMREFSVAEGADRRGVVLLISRMLGVVATQHTLSEGGAKNATKSAADDAARASIADVKQKIASHWRAGNGEKAKLRVALKEALTSLTHGFSTVFDAVVGTPQGSQTAAAATTSASSSIVPPSSSGCEADGSARGGIAPAPTAEERTYALTLLRELGEIQRQADVEMSRAQETSTLVEFISKELAAQKPITTLMETALGNAQRMGTKMRQVEVASAEWRQQVQSLGRIEVGLYNVVDALHQEMLKSVETIIDSCEETIASAFSNSNGGRRFDRIPSHILEGLDRERDIALSQCRQERSAVSETISSLRLKSNYFYTHLCPDEKKALQRAASEEEIREALKARNAFTGQTNNDITATPQAAGEKEKRSLHDGGGNDGIASQVNGDGGTTTTNDNDGASSPSSAPPPQQPQPSVARNDLLSDAWFCVIPDASANPTQPGGKKKPAPSGQQDVAHYRTFCAMQFFPFLQQRNVAWACHILGDLTATINDATMQLNRIRYACEAALARYLKDAEQHAYDALVATAVASNNDTGGGSTYFPDAGKTSPVDKSALLRTRADRDGWNGDLGVHVTTVVRETIHHLVGIPQSTMAAQHEFFLFKAYEWIEHLRTAESTAVAMHNSAAQCVKKEDVERMLAASDNSNSGGSALVRVNGEVDRFQAAELHRQLVVDSLRRDELERLDFMRKQKEDDDHSERALRLLRTLETGNSTPVDDVRRKLQVASNEHRRAAQSAKLKRLTDTERMMKEKGFCGAGMGSVRTLLEQQQKQQDSTTAHDPLAVVSSGGEHGSAVGATTAATASLPLLHQQLVACGALLLRSDGALVSPFARDAAFERRKNVYIRNRCSNTDIFVGECVKRGCAISDSIRTQLSARPCVHDALVMPLQGAQFAGGGTLLLDTLGDLLWMNPLQYLSLSHCGLTNRDAQLLSTHLGGHPTLCSLDLRHNHLITDAAPILRLLDMNAKLLLVAVQGTGLSEAGVKGVQRTCLQHRHERRALEPAEMCVLVRHFQTLSDPIDGMVSLARIEALVGERTAAGGIGHKPSRGSNTSSVAVAQGLIALHCGVAMKHSDHWGPADVLQSLFPKWHMDTITMLAAAFARSV